MTEMTQTESTASPEFLALTELQREWVTAFLAHGGDAVAATKEICGDKSRPYLAMYQRRLQNSPVVQAAIAVARSETPADQYHRDLKVTLRLIDEQLQKTETGSIAAQRMLSQRNTLVREIAGILTPEMLGATSKPANDSSVAVPEAPTQPAPETPAHKFSVGDIAILENNKYRVTAIREDGSVSEADPYEV